MRVMLADPDDRLPFELLCRAGGQVIAGNGHAVAGAISEAVWATIRLVNELGGTTFEAYEHLLEYGETVDLGLDPRSAADLVLRMIEARSDQADAGPGDRGSCGPTTPER